MDLRSALNGTLGYSHRLPKSQPAQKHLWQIPREPPPQVPLGLRVLVSGSGQSLPVVPWIALLDPDVTTTATDGLYLVYLYDSSLRTVYLSMNQGATQHRRNAEQAGLKGRAAERAAIAEITDETVAIRDGLGDEANATLLVIGLEASHFLPAAYEAGSIAAIEYSLGDLPPNEQLAADLARFAVIYRQSVDIKGRLSSDRVLRTSPRSERNRRAPVPSPPVFAPKDSSDYLAYVGAATQRRSRLHEALIREFGEHLRTIGAEPATNVHPRDLTLTYRGSMWLVEAKTVGANAEIAVREAIGQLFAYRHFYYRDQQQADPNLLALFNAPIGGALEQLLMSLDIDFVYRDGAQWVASKGAHGLIQTDQET